MKTSDASWAVCPLTLKPFIEPVIDHEGNSYEKVAILEWLKDHSTSPITRNPLSVNQLCPNRALKDLIDNDHSSLPSTVNSSPLTSDDDDEAEDTDQTFLWQLASKASVKTVCTKTDRVGLVRVKVPDDASERHLPASIVCVIDESYSMDGAATTEEDQEGKSGLSLLDIVKHATQTVIETLGPKDELAIVTYADSAEVKLPFMQMTPDNKQKASQVVKSLRTHGSTNLWSGLLQAMELVSKTAKDIFLLTDGMPNIHPPRGELETFQRYQKKQSSWNTRVSTFGFGYDLDSKLLNDIAIEGDGQYCFIPDSSFVGTIFINATSNVLSTALTTSTVVFHASKEPEIMTSQNKESSQTLCLSLPSLCYGQTLDIIPRLNDVSNAQEDTGSITHIDIEIASLRTRLVSMIRGAEERFQQLGQDALALAQADCKRLIGEFDTLISSGGIPSDDQLAILQAMNEDLIGQITEAYSRYDWHQRWGRHYLLSLARAHELQRCTNFKDPGLQVYATEKFSLIRDVAEDIFCKLPPPKPSRPPRNPSNYRPVRSMSSYYDVTSGCLAKGDVRLADGRYVPVSSVGSGDLLLTRGGPVRVRCVVTTRCANGIQELVELDSGVLVTPWHPVRFNGTDKWSFPADLAPIKMFSCDRVYNFVLENGATAIPIGPFEAISLGHGIEDDPVAKHEYFGSSKVIQDLSQMVGWDQGRVHLGTNPGRRDPESGLITSFVQKVETNTTTKTDTLLDSDLASNDVTWWRQASPVASKFVSAQ